MFSDVLRHAIELQLENGSVALPPPKPESDQMGGMLGFGKGRAFALGRLVQGHFCGGAVVLPVHRLLTSS